MAPETLVEALKHAARILFILAIKYSQGIALRAMAATSPKIDRAKTAAFLSLGIRPLAVAIDSALAFLALALFPFGILCLHVFVIVSVSPGLGISIFHLVAAPVIDRIILFLFRSR